MKIKCYLTNKFLKEYIKDKLFGWQMNFVANHLRSCPKCMERHFKMTKILRAQDKRKKKEKIFEEISAQIDFEKLKNKTLPLEFNNINNPQYETQFNEVYAFVELIEKSLDRSKRKSEIDVIQKVLNRIN